jgi:hypothetical protein
MPNIDAAEHRMTIDGAMGDWTAAIRRRNVRTDPSQKRSAIAVIDQRRTAAVDHSCKYRWLHAPATKFPL